MEFNWLLAYLGGVGTSISARMFYDYLSTTVPPFISEKLYKDISVSGDWTIEHPCAPCDGEGFESDWTLKVKIKQTGQQLSGTAEAKCMKGKSLGKDVSYRVVGKISNGLLDATFIDTSPDARNRSTFLMLHQGDGKCLQGYRAFLGRNKNVIRAVACHWVRPDGTTSCSGG